MRSKKARAKTAKPVGRVKRAIGLTSAIGPKATTAVVLVVLAAGIWVGSHQRLAAKAKSSSLPVESEMTPEPAPAPTTASTARTHDVRAQDAKTHETSASLPVNEGTVASTKPAKGPVTLEECLEQSGDAFHLKGTTGVDAPKARSWKTGFLHKGSATVDVVDSTASLGLANRVGTRVSVTGTLVDREMQARAIHRVASSCS